MGKLFGPEGLSFKLPLEAESEGTQKAEKLAVNVHLWHAALKVFSFVPLNSADPHGGLFTTQWFVLPQYSGELFKAVITFLSQELNAQSVHVSLFRQNKDFKGTWGGFPSAELAQHFKEEILSQACQLEAQKKNSR